MSASIKDSGLQAERTALAWSRTSFAVLVSGVLVLLKDPRVVTGVGLLISVVAGTVALGIFLIGRRRQHILALDPLPARITARGAIRGAGTGALVLMLIVVLDVGSPLV